MSTPSRAAARVLAGDPSGREAASAAPSAPAAARGLAPSTGPLRRPRAAIGVAEASAGMVARGVSVRPPDVVFVKALVEDSEGLAGVFAERGGELVLAAPASRAVELDALLADLAREIGARIEADPFSTGAGGPIRSGEADAS